LRPVGGLVTRLREFLVMGYDQKQVASICSIPRDKIIAKF
jgi:hypothetical protein